MCSNRFPISFIRVTSRTCINVNKRKKTKSRSGAGGVIEIAELGRAAGVQRQ